MELDTSKERESRLNIEELQGYFKIVFDGASEMRKIFITFSHSNGFAIDVSLDGPFVNIEPKRNSFTVINENDLVSISENQGYRKIDLTEEEYKNVVNKLWIYDLVKVLNTVLKEGDYIDLMLMVNCNMQILDSLFQLKKKVNILIASQTQFSYYGFHYSALIATLKKYPEINPVVLSKEIVRQFVEKYTFQIEDGIDKLSCNTLFAHDLTHVYQLMELVNNVSDYLCNLIDDIATKTIIQDLRINQVADVSNYPGHILNLQFIDFGGFLKVLSKKLNDKQNRKLAVYYKMYRAILKNLNIASFIGDDYTIQDEYAETKFNLSGVSVYFPTTKEGIRGKNNLINYLNIAYKSKYDIATRWDDFLRKFYDTSN
jgi:hypothetical protein